MFRIKQLRIDKGLSMRQTAIELGIPYTTYISYEKEDREPNSETLIMLADYFNCSVDYLIGRSDNRRIIQNHNANEKKTQAQIELSNHESKVVSAYRNKPDMQPAVDKLLGVEQEDLIPTVKAARSDGNTQPIEIVNMPDLSKFNPDDSDL